jgi:hypothetical protein
MKSQSNEFPLKIQDLGDGTSHFNYNVIETFTEENGTVYKYDQVVIKNPVTYSKKIIALVREKYTIDDEIAFIRQKGKKVKEFEDYDVFVESCKILANE